MSTYRLKIYKYYRLSAMGDAETENVSAFIDTSSRRISVYCGRSEKERVPILLDTQEFPKIIFRESHVYVLYSLNTKDGFRLTLDQDGSEKFKEIITSIRKLIATDRRASSPEVVFERAGIPRDKGNEKRKNPSRHSQGAPPREVSIASSDRKYHSQAPRVRQESTPQVPIPNCRRDSTAVFPRNPSSSPQMFLCSPSYSSPIDHSQPRGVSFDLNSVSTAYNPNPHSINSFEHSVIRPTEHEYGESVPAKKSKRGSGHEKKKTADAYVQTDDLLDILIEDEEFTQKALQSLMNNPQFKSLVEATQKRLEKMDVVEMKRLHWCNFDDKFPLSEQAPPLFK
ncbi:hypothetical protein CRE_25917 [Caenorhabditis remanei]|uniref:Uncharacterized protein n=1 Tax=Caenorhabditis remanei TaxID=31234 RepID=E3NI40_CAERE|nr:hypothetical protein CRE_25917 [Caenorhabditis remanei]